mgnify:FL=1
MYPKSNRLCAFRGKFLHGVIPGHPEQQPHQTHRHRQPQQQSRRITLMIAFWETITIRSPTATHRSARALPSLSSVNLPIKQRKRKIPQEQDNGSREHWPRWIHLLQPVRVTRAGRNSATATEATSNPVGLQVVLPQAMPRVWEALDQQPSGANHFPSYEECFQGF